MRKLRELLELLKEINSQIVFFEANLKRLDSIVEYTCQQDKEVSNEP